MSVALWSKLKQGIGILEGIDRSNAIPLSEATGFGNNRKPWYAAKR